MSTALLTRENLDRTMLVAREMIERIDSVGSRSATVTSFNFVACENCGHSLREQLPQFEAQLWGCRECGEIRQWGLARPLDKKLLAALHCDSCEAVTRHGFVAVVGR